jgi:hypothetical protein
MIGPKFTKRYECGDDDYFDTVREDSAAVRGSFWVEQLPGYSETRVYAFGPSLTGWVIGLRLGSNRRSGTVISRWNFVPAWSSHLISWDYEAADVISKLDLGNYRDVLDNKLRQILERRWLLRRGYPIEGLLSGFSNQAVPKSGEAFTSGRLKLTDDDGHIVSVGVDLRVYRTDRNRSSQNVQPRWTIVDKWK